MSLGDLSVNERRDGFLLDGKPWFWLADTCWSAFTNISLEDWDYYLTRRAEQGVNVLQINTLPQWDRCRPDLGIYPYASEDGVLFDWDRPDPAYWERAREMCRMAVEHGIRPALVLMWCNYVPGTWGSAIAARSGTPTMPLDEVRRHVERVVRELDEFRPVYVVTGDTDWKSDDCLPYYDAALSTVCELAPTRLRTMHVNRANRIVPELFVDRLDFLMFQPGHNALAQDEAWKLPEDLRVSYPGKPMVNSEPCYEMMGASRHVYVRFNAENCRASAWSSIFAGACAGVTYGAHGIWNWQTSRSSESALGEGFDAPFRWQEALQLPGVWDYGMIPQVLASLTEGWRLSVEPAQDLLDDARESIRAAKIGSRVAVYLPRATALSIRGDYSAVDALVLDLEDKRVAHLPTSFNGESGCTRVTQHPFTHDALVVLGEA